jgi:carboxylate-amine ligase
MTRTGVVRSMKDFYWDIRPKPEYGTIEIRVFDTPLTVERAAALAGFVQSLAAWFLQEQPFVPHEDDYMVYTYNRFQACRFGLEAVYVDPATGQHMPLRDHILLTLTQLEWHSEALNATQAPSTLLHRVGRGPQRRALAAREATRRERLLAEVVRQAALSVSRRTRAAPGSAHGRVRSHRALLHPA